MMNHSCELEIPFNDATHIQYIINSFAVDGERNEESAKEFEIEGNVLKIRITAKTTRMLRIATWSFFEFLTLGVATIEQFGEV
ncbi:EKC/KEOPS complex subunit LAGE3-like [Carpediemonas membranifera]|uniref:EKC/KEOPS complex subunit LAGE3-like n=1 Tax=Carpediemonas membranifera TaxID=201153 RepID=A0A8J6DZ46_9EUKA|nr:EKC/KEOPS complex subunit LAGE3-like [Carpediemonas membranifera]|eukprot:KAG9393129.1 EKC/KEOPS complex subunit LAGE3-like [Carpediemonas membranifera]